MEKTYSFDVFLTLLTVQSSDLVIKLLVNNGYVVGSLSGEAACISEEDKFGAILALEVSKDHLISSEDDVKNIIGKHVYFGEILGKHSEVEGTIEKDDITELTDDQDFIEKAIKYGVVNTGYNPFSYVRSDDE